MFRLTIVAAALVAVALLLNLAPVEAGMAGPWQHGSGHGGLGWLGFVAWPLRSVLWFGLLLLVAMLILRLFGVIGRKQAPPPVSAAAPETTEALEILKRRFAEGEIDARQFESMKTRLSEA